MKDVFTNNFDIKMMQTQKVAHFYVNRCIDKLV